MFIENVGNYAGQIWCALEGKEALTQKEIKKVTKLKDKEFYLGLGWLLREDKINVTEGETENYYSLK
ncbi:MAG: winged helix-turn-helix domain-containing protein [Bacteroidaceae bacterium]|nr:winged helix-turn-helix domain-containing protein [Bacteroidaceae bacterium]